MLHASMLVTVRYLCYRRTDADNATNQSGCGRLSWAGTIHVSYHSRVLSPDREKRARWSGCIPGPFALVLLLPPSVTRARRARRVVPAASSLGERARSIVPSSSAGHGGCRFFSSTRYPGVDALLHTRLRSRSGRGGGGGACIDVLNTYIRQGGVKDGWGMGRCESIGGTCIEQHTRGTW